MAYNTGTTRLVYQDVAAGSSNKVYLTDWDDISTTHDKVSPTNLFGSVDQAGDLLISSGVYDEDTTDELETGTFTGVAKGGTDTITGEASDTVVIAATATFETDLVKAGDIALNSTTGEQAVIVSVDSETQITTVAIESSTPGEGWEPDDEVKIVTGTKTILTDSEATFQTNEVYPGCIVEMDVSGERARVVSVTSETALVCTGLAQNFTYEQAYTILDPFTWTVIAGRTYGQVNAGEQPFNDFVNLPYADGYTVELTKGGHLTVTYNTQYTTYPS